MTRKTLQETYIDAIDAPGKGKQTKFAEKNCDYDGKVEGRVEREGRREGEGGENKRSE